MKTEELGIELDGVLVKSTGWFKVANKSVNVMQLLWNHIATSSITGQRVPQKFYATATIGIAVNKEKDEEARS